MCSSRDAKNNEKAKIWDFNQYIEIICICVLYVCYIYYIIIMFDIRLFIIYIYIGKFARTHS